MASFPASLSGFVQVKTHRRCERPRPGLKGTWVKGGGSAGQDRQHRRNLAAGLSDIRRISTRPVHIASRLASLEYTRIGITYRLVTDVLFLSFAINILVTSNLVCIDCSIECPGREYLATTRKWATHHHRGEHRLFVTNRHRCFNDRSGALSKETPLHLCG